MGMRPKTEDEKTGTNMDEAMIDEETGKQILPRDLVWNGRTHHGDMRSYEEDFAQTWDMEQRELTAAQIWELLEGSQREVTYMNDPEGAPRAFAFREAGRYLMTKVRKIEAAHPEFNIYDDEQEYTYKVKLPKTVWQVLDQVNVDLIG